MKRFALAITLSYLLSACAGHPQEVETKRDELIPAQIAPEFAKPLELVEIPKPIPFPNQLKPLPHLSAPATTSSPTQSVNDANAAARIEPTPSGFINAIQVWPYSPAALYQVYSSPGQTTDLVFQGGEHLIDVSVSDPVRWIVGDTSSGTADAQQSHLIVKPTRAGLKANLIITTDRRTYYVELHSATETWMAAVSWEYPSDRLAALKVANQKRETDTSVASGLQLDRLQFRYRITGDDVAWKPLRAFDDGQKVYIQFPSDITQGEMPPLFVLGSEGDAQLVNYRVRAPYYIVDRLFSAAELKLGAKDAKSVRIIRSDLEVPRRKKGRR